jgi:hypothetical protein
MLLIKVANIYEKYSSYHKRICNTIRVYYFHLLPQPLFGLLCLLRMIDDDEYGAVCGMRIDKGDQSTLKKPAPMPLCPP